jgi:O-antigen ligase
MRLLGPASRERVSVTGEPRSTGALLLLVGLAAVTVAAVIVGNGNLALALTPAILAILLFLVFVLPLRAPLLALLVMAWAIEAPGDAFAMDKIQTPWKIVGQLLWGKLSEVVPVSSLVIRGIDLVMLLLVAVVVYRHTRGSTLDRPVDWVETPRPLDVFIWLSLGACVWMTVYGLASGGSSRFAQWQTIRWLYIPIVYTLMRQGLRGLPDARTLGQVILGVGIFRSGEAILFRFWYPQTVWVEGGDNHDWLPHATTHHDSVLFATCLGILGALLLEVPSKKTLKFCVALLAIYVPGMMANGRRLVWVEVALVALVFWMMTPWRPLKRKAARVLSLTALPLVLYVAAGWQSDASVFSPVKKIRSMVDPDVSTSTLWRDLENYDLIYTYARNPILGSGFGHPYLEPIKLPDVSKIYELEPYIPHNSVLGLWAYGGLVGFTLLWFMFPAGMFFTARAYRWSRTSEERVTVLSAAAIQVCLVMQGYTDLGFGTWGPVFTLSAAYALVGKICVANGAWPRAPRTVPTSGPDGSSGSRSTTR